jgi:DNA processing protein
LFEVQTATREERASLLAEELSAAQKKVYGLLGVDDAVHVDELVEKAELSSSEVLSALFELEMKGIVRQMPGKQFVKSLL